MEQPMDMGAVTTERRGLVREREAVPQLQKRTRPTEVIVRSILLFCGIVSIFTTLGIVYVLGEQALLFTTSRAFVIAKIAIADEEAAATVAESIDEGERTLSLDFEGERIPFNNNQLITIGDEVMRIVDRGRNTITVERGVNDTEAVAHDVDEVIFGMRDQQIRPQNELTDQPDDNVIELLPGYGVDFEAGVDIQIGTELMTIETVELDSLVVDRIPDNTIIELQRSRTIEQSIDAWEAEQITNFVTAATNDGRVNLDSFVTEAELEESVIQSYPREDLEAEVGIMMDDNDLRQILSAQLQLASPDDVAIEDLTDDQLRDVILDALPEDQLRDFLLRSLSDDSRQEFQIAALTGPEQEDIIVEVFLEAFDQDESLSNIAALDVIDSEFATGLSEAMAGATGLRTHDANDDAITVEDPVSIVEFFTHTRWAPQIGDYGIWPLALSTIMITAIAILVAVPLGLGAAIFLSEYADPRVRNVLKPVLEVLAGVPTVVYGFFALSFVTPILQDVFGGVVEFNNMLSAGLVVGILLVPLISSMSEDALTAVPRALREASYGLGATRLETTIKVVLPAAISGIVAAFILAVSRAVGETMIVAIAAGSGPNFTFNIFEGAETMTGHIARISGGDLSYNSIDYNSIFAIGLMLFVMTLVLNIFSGWVSNRLREEY